MSDGIDASVLGWSCKFHHSSRSVVMSCIGCASEMSHPPSMFVHLEQSGHAHIRKLPKSTMLSVAA